MADININDSTEKYVSEVVPKEDWIGRNVGRIWLGKDAYIEYNNGTVTIKATNINIVADSHITEAAPRIDLN